MAANAACCGIRNSSPPCVSFLPPGWEEIQGLLRLIVQSRNVNSRFAHFWARF